MKFIISGLCIAWGALLTLFAVASTFEYEVHFVLPDDKIETVMIEHSHTVEIISVINDSYEVVEWYTDETLTQVFNRETKVTAELYLYAKVRYLTTFKVFFDLYDGEILHDDQLIEVNNGEVVGQINLSPEKEGYNFTGWFDWFCKDTSLANKTKKMGNIIKQIKPGGKVDVETSYVWFKNNCPLNGPLYDDFRIADIETNNTLIVVQIDCAWNDTKYTVYERLDGFDKPVLKTNSSRELVKWLNKGWNE